MVICYEKLTVLCLRLSFFSIFLRFIFSTSVNNQALPLSNYEQIHKMAAIYRLKSGSQGTGSKR